MPGLVERFESDSRSVNDTEYDSDGDMFESDSESDDDSNEEDEYLEAAYLLRNRPTPKPKPESTKTRASIFFSIENKNGVRKQYFGLLDTGCTGWLVTKELVD